MVVNTRVITCQVNVMKSKAFFGARYILTSEGLLATVHTIFRRDGHCPLGDLPSGSPTTVVQPRTRKVTWWPEMAEGGVQLMALPGLVLLGLES